MKRMITNPLAVAVLILLFISSGFAWAEEGKVNVAPGKIVTHEEESIISLVAARALRHIAQARYAIHQQDVNRAIEELRKSLTAMNQIKTVLPTAKAKDYIRVAILHLSYEKPTEVMKDLIPIYASVEAIEDLVPVDVAREHVDKAKKNLEKGNREEAKKEFELANQALIDTETDLPLAHTEAQVLKAYAYLAQNQSERADKALKSAEKGVRYVGLSIYSPMVKSKKILKQSSEDFAGGRLQAVRAGLRQAKVYLQEVIKTGDDRIKVEAQKLLKDIVSVEDQLESSGKGAASAIDGLWEKARALSERSAEYVSTDWKELTTTSKTKINLMEAKLHVAYAQIYQDTTGELAKVKPEIDEADSYLKKAEQHADDKTQARLVAISEELKEARAHLEEKGPDVRARYEKIKADLGELIRKM
jgi:flagellin-specific chaperone FliS